MIQISMLAYFFLKCCVSWRYFATIISNPRSDCFSGVAIGYPAPKGVFLRPHRQKLKSLQSNIGAKSERSK